MAKVREVLISEFVDNNRESIQEYKSIEHLRVIKKIESERVKKEDEISTKTKKSVSSKKDMQKTLYLCENQFGDAVVKSEFLLKFGYQKNELDCFVPRYQAKLYAIKIDSPIKFYSTQGESCSLNQGDYVVIDGNHIYGARENAFETNYRLKDDAQKFNRKYTLKIAKLLQDEKNTLKF